MTGAVEENSEPRRHFVQHVPGMRCAERSGAWRIPSVRRRRVPMQPAHHQTSSSPKGSGPPQGPRLGHRGAGRSHVSRCTSPTAPPLRKSRHRDRPRGNRSRCPYAVALDEVAQARTHDVLEPCGPNGTGPDGTMRPRGAGTHDRKSTDVARVTREARPRFEDIADAGSPRPAEAPKSRPGAVPDNQEPTDNEDLSWRSRGQRAGRHLVGEATHARSPFRATEDLRHGCRRDRRPLSSPPCTRGGPRTGP